MKIKWLGHACFLIVSDEGLRIITDPYTSGSGGVGYAPIDESADVVTTSHDHFDHNAVAAVPGNPEVVKGTGITDVKGIQFKGIPTYHDDCQGKRGGSNIVFCFPVDDLRLCHLGDLGHRLSKEQITEIGAVDLLFIPVGGHFTMDVKVAAQVCNDLNPRVIVTMHYKTPKLDFPITGVDDFIAGKKNVRKLDSTEVNFEVGKLPDVTEIVVLNPAL